MSYEYLNTRLHFMMVKLLGPQQYERYLEMHDLGEFTAALAETDYAQEIERASVEHATGYPLVETALTQNTQRCFTKLYSMAFGEARPLVRILLERFEVFDLKTILRGFHAGVDADETARSLFPTVLYPTAFYQELLKRDSIGGVIDYLLTVGNRYYKPLSARYPEYEAGHKLAVLESAIDDYYFSGSRRTLQTIGDDNAVEVRRALGTEVDLLNLAYALRAVDEVVDSEEKYRYILDGGERLSREAVTELINSPDKASFFRKLEATDYGKRLGAFEDTTGVGEFQDHLEQYLYQTMCHYDPGRTFDIQMARVYVWRKILEVTDLRVIASGLSRGAPREEVEDKMIRVDGITPGRAVAA
jgi:V/A-type H+-transporting ATPase subunit C